jgi:hypothetical protein
MKLGGNQEGSTALWAYAKATINAAVANGYLPAGLKVAG